MQHRWRLCFRLATILLALREARALDPSEHITQYAHASWRTQDGFLTGSPTAITQTTDGYLWIGTANGLFRFDGVRFVPWAPTNHSQLKSAEISALLGAQDGSLWVGAAYDLFRWRDNALSRYSTKDGFVQSILQRKSGAIWIVRSRYPGHDGPLCEGQNRLLRCYGNSEGVPLPYAGSLAEDANGNLWIGASSRLVRWQPGSSTTYFLNGLQKSEGLHGVDALATGANGVLWVGCDYPGRELGLRQLENGVWKTFSSAGLNGATLAVSRIFVDRDGAVWIGTENQGLYRIVDRNVDHFDSADGLSSDAVTALFQDHEGTIWVATSKGIDSFRDLPVISFSKREGLHSDGARSVLAARDGTIWIGNVGSLDRVRDGVISSILPKDGLPGREVTSLFQDRAGRIFVGVDNSLFLFEHSKFSPVIKLDPRDPQAVFSMTGTGDGSLWVATESAASSAFVHIQNGQILERLRRPKHPLMLVLANDPNGGFWLAGDGLKHWRDHEETNISELGSNYGYIRNTVVDEDGFVWFGATKGLLGFRAGKLQALTIKNGLPCDRINALVLDKHDALWLYAQCGLIKIDHSELVRWWNNPAYQVTNVVFDALDGVQGAASSFRPAAARSSDGRLWFVNGSILQTIDPDNLHKNRVPPPVRIEEVIADTKTYLPEKTVNLPKLSRDIEIKYTALSFVVPQRVRFLSPKRYQFHVIASNNDGVWNKDGAILTFAVPPTWYQTFWFKMFCAISVITLAYAAYLLRMGKYAAAIRYASMSGLKNGLDWPGSCMTPYYRHFRDAEWWLKMGSNILTILLSCAAFCNACPVGSIA